VPTATPTATGTATTGADSDACWVACISGKGAAPAAFDQCAAKCPQDQSGEACADQCWQQSGCAQQESVCDAAEQACEQQCPLPPGAQGP
jgi:hypothetical protein